MRYIIAVLAIFCIVADAAYGQVANGRATTAAPTYTDATVAPLSLDTAGALRVINSGSPSGTQDVNVVEVGGNAVTTTVPVSGTVTATGPLTDAELRAAAVDVDVLSTVGLTDTELRATPVPVSGTVTASGPLTDAELRATPVPVGPIAAGTNNIGDVDLASAIPAGTNNIGDVDLASAIPAGTNNIGDVDIRAVVGGTSTELVTCNSSAVISTASSGNTQLVALTAGQIIRVCGYNFIADGNVDVQLIYGTGTACATGETDLTGAYPLDTQAGLVVQSPFWLGLATATANALCIELSAAIQVSGVVFYTKF